VSAEAKMREAIEQALEVYDACGSISPARAQKLRDSLVADGDGVTLSMILAHCPRCGVPSESSSDADTVNCPYCGTVWHRFGSDLPYQQRGYGG